LGLINFNGEILPDDSPIFTINRAIQYGDGLFETLRNHNGEILFFQDHFDRLIEGMRALKINVPVHFTLPFFHKQFLDLAYRDGMASNARLRIGVFRSGKGIYTPESHSAEFYLQIIPLNKGFEWEDRKCELGVYSQIPKNYSSISFFKSANALPYVMAAIFKVDHNFDDCILLNSFGKIADAISSNIFWLERKRIFSVPMADGGVAGVMSKNLIAILKHHRFFVEEKSITPHDLAKADEVFLTNVIWGIKPVTRFHNTEFSTLQAKEIFNLLKEILK
jgi:branched-chain amino acid aminotransferase